MTVANSSRADSPAARSPRFGRLWTIIPLVILAMTLFATSARAHDINATVTCSSVTINWVDFDSTGSGNGGLNTPRWTVVFTPAGGGAPVTLNGTVSFPGSSFSLTVALPAGNGTVVASSEWTASETRDGAEGPGSRILAISNCQTITPPITPPVTPAPPASQGVAGQSIKGSCPSRPSLRGVSEKTRSGLSAYIPASGVKRVTFYLDGRIVTTVTKPKANRFSIKISARKLSYGAHRLKAKVTMADSVCASAAVSGTFVRVKAAAVRPTFTG